MSFIFYEDCKCCLCPQDWFMCEICTGTSSKECISKHKESTWGCPHEFEGLEVSSKKNAETIINKLKKLNKAYVKKREDIKKISKEFKGPKKAVRIINKALNTNKNLKLLANKIIEEGITKNNYLIARRLLIIFENIIGYFDAVRMINKLNANSLTKEKKIDILEQSELKNQNLSAVIEEYSKKLKVTSEDLINIFLKRKEDFENLIASILKEKGECDLKNQRQEEAILEGEDKPEDYKELEENRRVFSIFGPCNDASYAQYEKLEKYLNSEKESFSVRYSKLKKNLVSLHDIIRHEREELIKSTRLCMDRIKATNKEFTAIGDKLMLGIKKFQIKIKETAKEEEKGNKKEGSKGLWLCPAYSSEEVRAKKRLLKWDKEIMKIDDTKNMEQWLSIIKLLNTNIVRLLGLSYIYDINNEKVAKPLFNLLGGMKDLKVIEISDCKLSHFFLEDLIRTLKNTNVRCVTLERNTIDDIRKSVVEIADNICKTNIEHLSARKTPLNDLFYELVSNTQFRNCKLRWMELYYENLYPDNIDEYEKKLKETASMHEINYIEIEVVKKYFLLSPSTHTFRINLKELRLVSKESEVEKISKHDCEC